MSSWAEAYVWAVQRPMAAYMRHRFPFLGVKVPASGAVVAFVEGPGAAVLSGLSKREALKNVRKTSAASVDPGDRRS